MSITHNPDRLIPFAKDHDRLQLALLYIEAESERHKETEVALEALRIDEETIRQCLEKYSKIRETKIKRYIHEHHPAKYIDSTGRPAGPSTDNELADDQNRAKTKGWRDQEMERAFEMERSDMNTLTVIMKRIQEIEDERRRLSERAAQKEGISKLIEELHATAFDGATPEFPHEDQLEALVEVAKIALKGEQAVLDKLHEENGLVELDQLAHSAQGALYDIFEAGNEMRRNFNRERPIVLTIFITKEFLKLAIINRCKTAAQRCQAWKEGTDNHFSQHPDTLLSPRAQAGIPQHNHKELLSIFFRAVPPASVTAVHHQVHQARNEIQTAINATKRMKGQAEISVTKAKTMLELRRRQLAAARSQILDHVIDPEKCPLEQRAEQLPDYPEQLSIHVNAYVNDIVRSRLNRARRTTHPPVLLPARFQPPTYDELDDPELLRRHYQREVPPVEGATPEYSAKPNYGENIQTDTSEIGPTIQGELEELVSNAREQLGLKSKAQRDQFNEMIGTVIGMMEGSGINLIMPGPGARF
ncbi:unnamed protein product [Rhizoctonia solani]|uniref:Uncharacterized protein n=1 Tax=Rhizoctonia solani TaxID=456999 RepID=A0A8H3GIA3_9AGAM|nr:unnamed protein product [Rhizoctonia solani]